MASRLDDFMAEFERLWQLDQEWREHRPRPTSPCGIPPRTRNAAEVHVRLLVTATSLQEVLLEQVRESTLTDEQRPVAELLVGNIDDYGYLKTSVDELSFSTNIPVERIQDVLKVIHFWIRPSRRAQLARVPDAPA